MQHGVELIDRLLVNVQSWMTVPAAFSTLMQGEGLYEPPPHSLSSNQQLETTAELVPQK